MGVEAEAECNLLVCSLRERLNVFCLTRIIQRYRHTCGSRRYRWHLSITATLQHIIKRPFKVNPSNCSLMLVELSLCELIILLVDLLFELTLVVFRLLSFRVSFPSLLTKFPP